MYTDICTHTHTNTHLSHGTSIYLYIYVFFHMCTYIQMHTHTHMQRAPSARKAAWNAGNTEQQSDSVESIRELTPVPTFPQTNAYPKARPWAIITKPDRFISFQCPVLFLLRLGSANQTRKIELLLVRKIRLHAVYEAIDEV